MCATLPRGGLTVVAVRMARMAISAEVLGAVDDAHEGAEGNHHDRVGRRE